MTKTLNRNFITISVVHCHRFTSLNGKGIPYEDGNLHKVGEQECDRYNHANWWSSSDRQAIQAQFMRSPPDNVAVPCDRLLLFLYILLRQDEILAWRRAADHGTPQKTVSLFLKNGIMLLRILKAQYLGKAHWEHMLLKTNPRKFEYAKPIKEWRKDWPPSYSLMLENLQEKWPEGRGVQEFVRVLQLHKDYPADLVEQAIEQALSYGCVHLDGVLHCLHQLMEPKEPPQSLDLSDRPDLQHIGNQPIDLSRYEKLLKYSW